MAWLHELRDSVQEVLEWVSQQPCTCRSAGDPWTHERCWAHRAHFALGGLYWYGVPTRRFPRPLTPKYLPAHRVLVAHDWRWRKLDNWGSREREHHREGCRIWCRDCGAIAPGGCLVPTAGRDVQAGETLYWWADVGWSRIGGNDLQPERSCLWLLRHQIEYAPRPANAPEMLYDLRDSWGEDRRLPPREHRRPG